MSNFIFNISKGKDASFVDNINNNTPANSAFVVLLLKTVEADDSLRDYDNLADLLAGSSVEADFTNYERKVVTDNITLNINDISNAVAIDMPDQAWPLGGGTVDNTIGKFIVCYDPDTTSGTDSDLTPVYAFDFVATTNGNNLTAEINSSGLTAL